MDSRIRFCECPVCQTAIRELTSRPGATERQVAEKDARIADLEAADLHSAHIYADLQAERNGLQEQVAELKREIGERDAEVERLRNDAGLFHEVVKRLRGALIVSHIGVWTEWQAAIDLFVKAAQAQGHLARLACERYDRILELERCAADEAPQVAALRAQLEEAQRKEAERIANTVAWELRSYSDRGSHTLICRISGLIQRVCGIARDARNASDLGGDSREER